MKYNSYEKGMERAIKYIHNNPHDDIQSLLNIITRFKLQSNEFEMSVSFKNGIIHILQERIRYLENDNYRFRHEGV